MIGSVLESTIPVFAVVALGYALSFWKPLHAPTLAHLAMTVTSPALVFTVVSRTSFDPRQWLTLAGGALAIMAGTALLTVAVAFRDRTRLRALLLPTVFWNAGNMALPVSHLAFGEDGLHVATIVFVTMVVGQATVGIWIAKGRGGGTEVLRQPLFHASWLGVVVVTAGFTTPPVVAIPIALVGDMAIPLMLINLGVQLRMLAVREVNGALISVGIRMGGGLACAVAFVSLFSVEGVERQVLLLSGVLPAAVINIVLAQKYDTEPGLVASAIVLGTLVALVSVPGLLYFAG